MKSFKPVLVFILSLLLWGCKSENHFDQNQTISFEAEDGLEVTADLYPVEKSKPIILMFHQSASSRGEYQTIAPRLQARGFNCLAVDLRWGKKDFWNGVENETARIYGSYEVVDGFENTEQYSYEKVWPRMFDSYQDMKASVEWVRSKGFDGDLIVWGSSFSAMLQFQLAAEMQDEISAMVSYSPGEYYGRDTTMLTSWARQVDVPVYIASGKDSSEYEMTRPIFEILQNGENVYFHSKSGRHGSSMLINNEDNWPSLNSFLSKYQKYDAGDYLGFAEKTADWLDQQKTDSLAIWPDDIQNGTTSLSISNGVSGQVLFHLDLFDAVRDEQYLNEAKFAADYLLKNLPQTTDSLDAVPWAFSPYGNICGTGFALTEMYKETGEEKYREGALKVLEVIDHFAKNRSDTISWDLGNDVLSGLSGTGLFLLYAHEQLQSQETLDMAISAGHTLISRAIKSESGYTWKRGQNGNFILPNFSHGPAGIGYFLARLYEITNDDTFLDAAKNAASYLDSIAYTEDNTYLIPYGFPDPGWRRAFDIGWAHGPAGVARFFYQMSKIEPNEDWLEKAKACFNGILMSGAMESVHPMFGSSEFLIDQRFGLAGVAGFCFDMYGVTGDQDYLTYGIRLTDHILSKASFGGGLHWPIERFGFMRDAGTMTSFTGYFYGSAGYGMVLLEAYRALESASSRIRFVDDPF